MKNGAINILCTWLAIIVLTSLSQPPPTPIPITDCVPTEGLDFILRHPIPPTSQHRVPAPMNGRWERGRKEEIHS